MNDQLFPQLLVESRSSTFRAIISQYVPSETNYLLQMRSDKGKVLKVHM